MQLCMEQVGWGGRGGVGVGMGWGGVGWYLYQ